jgi:hypothetical protein
MLNTTAKTLRKCEMKNLPIAATAILIILSITHVAQSAPKVALIITAPTGSAGADANLTGIYKGMPWLPCTVTNEPFGVATLNQKTPKTDTKPKDLLQFDINVTNEDINGDGIMDNDLYVFLLNPNATGIKGDFDAAGTDMSLITPIAQIWAVMSSSFSNNPSLLLPFAKITTIIPSKAVFKTADNFITASFKTTLLGSSMFFDNTTVGQNLPQGTWMIVAMLVDAKKFSYKKIKADQLQNPQNWEAWDAKLFFLGTPFPKPAAGTGLLAGGNGKCN